MKKIFLIIFLLFIICAPNITVAQVQLETGLPNIPGNRLDAGKELPQYINYLFIFGLGAITILALARMMTGGIKYILAAGNVGEKADAKDTIQQALLGLGLLLASYLLLRTINPDLVNLRNPNLTPSQFKGEITPKITPNMNPNTVEEVIVGAPCKAGDVLGTGRDYAICINGAWMKTSDMID
ncbi:MAG: hypothetical protein ABIG73_02150 [Patescibacteria group bacterium]